MAPASKPGTPACGSAGAAARLAPRPLEVEVGRGEAEQQPERGEEKRGRPSRSGTQAPRRGLRRGLLRAAGAGMWSSCSEIMVSLRRLDRGLGIADQEPAVGPTVGAMAVASHVP